MTPDFEKLFLNAPIAFAWHRVIYDEKNSATDVEYLLVNSAYEEVTGIKTQDIVGKRLTDVVPDVREMEFDWIGFYAQVAETCSSESTLQFVAPLGRWYDVMAFSSQKGYFATFLRDISEEVEEKTKQHFDSVRLKQWDALKTIYEVHIDLKGRYLFVNEAFEQDFTISAEQVLGKSCMESIYPEDHSKVLKVIVDLIEKPERSPVMIDIRKPFRNGHIVNTAWSFSLVLDSFGHPDKFVCFGLDNHELNELREKARNQDLVLRELFETILAGYWDWNLIEKTEYLSPAFKKMFGYEDHELENHPDTWQSLILPEDLSKVKAQYKKHTDSKGKVPFSLEVRYRHKDGSIVWVICAGRVIQWLDDGSPVRMIGCHIDITAIKQMEDELAENRQLLDSVINTQREMICRYLPDTTLTFVNDAYCKAFGISKEELIGKKFIEFIPDEDKPKALAHIASITTETPVVVQSHKSRLADGTIVIQEWNDTGIFDENGDAISYQSSGLDITQRFIAFEKLKESDDKFQDITINLPLVVWLSDHQNKSILFVNKAYEDIWGRSVHSLYDNPDSFSEAVHPADLPRFKKAFHSVEKDAMLACDFRIIRPDNTVRWVSTKQYPVYNEQNEIVRYTGMAVDITPLKQNELRVRKQNETLRQIAWEQSHIVRQPIVKVLGVAHLLRNEKGLSESEQDRFLDYLIESVNELDNMLKDIVKKSNEVEFELKKQEKPENP